MSVPHIRSRRRASPWRGPWLVPLSGHWIDAASSHLSHHVSLVRVTVAALRGSAPREAGASMLVDAVGTVGTIGGGRLEWHAVALARELLRDPRAAPVRVADLILGPELGQCCGGRVELWLEMRLPDEHARTAILEQMLAKQSAALGTIELPRLVEQTAGFTGADLKRLLDDGKNLLAYDKVRGVPLKPATEYFLSAVATVRDNKARYAEADVRARQQRPVRAPYYDAVGATATTFR